MSTITVTIIETARPPWRSRRRHQPWRWVAKTANEHSADGPACSTAEIIARAGL